ncbi:hypothetical protein Q6334_30190, partial [Klebsiella pneumoniae]|uniref:hypothetical protein n=1 Tax=Klebsiella pneumoniae TaxID=573 RepID=UPI00272F61DF
AMVQGAGYLLSPGKNWERRPCQPAGSADDYQGPQAGYQYYMPLFPTNPFICLGDCFSAQYPG